MILLLIFIGALLLGGWGWGVLGGALEVLRGAKFICQTFILDEGEEGEGGEGGGGNDKSALIDHRLSPMVNRAFLRFDAVGFF